MLRKVFEVEPLACPRCRQELVIVAWITEALVIDRILKHQVVDVLDIVSGALQWINEAVVGVAPCGTFAIAAFTAGTLHFDEIGRLQAYLVVYMGAVLYLTFLVLPLLLTSLTPFRYREILGMSKTALITAFAARMVIVVLPLLVDNTKKLFRKYTERHSETDRAVTTLYHVAYPFPALGRLMALLFIPFAAWFSGRVLGIEAYPGLIAMGVLSYFGDPVLATPLLLELYELPADLFQFFMAAGVYTSRVGDLLGVM